MAEQEKESGGMSRRDFLKLLGAAGTSVAFAPFVPWGKFMPNPSSSVPDGTHANLNTYPINHAEVITYPETADEVLNEEAFRKWQFIRLPEKFGGGRKDVSAFRAYSMICLHLWCLWKYWPDEGRMRGECPCHGSMYDVKTGTAYLGPASLQAPPSNTLPKLDFEADTDGFMYVLPPTWGVNTNGVVGYGRFA